MAETFYGPWSLMTFCEPGLYTEYFLIAGSDSSDGLYEPPDDGSHFDLTVTGEEWTIQFQGGFPDAGPYNYDPTRVDGFYPIVGRFAVLATPHEPKPFGGGYVVTHGLDVQLTSLDPLLSPPWERTPDFTVRQDGPYGRYGYLPPLRRRE